MRTSLMVMLVIGALWPITARAQSTTAFPALWEQRCARCHDSSAAADPQPPSREALMRMTPQRVHNALTVGSMAPNAVGLSASQIFTLVQGLTGRPEGDVIIAASAMKNQCGSGMRLGPLTGPQWNGWSPEPDGSRFQPAAAAGLTPEQVPQLKLKWAFGFPGGVSAWGPVTVAGGWLFVGSDNGAVYALDPRSGASRRRKKRRPK